jgi:hypothetical protein
MKKRVNFPGCMYSKASIHTVFYEQRRNMYNYLGGLVGGAQEAFAQGSINGWADTEWHFRWRSNRGLKHR